MISTHTHHTKTQKKKYTHEVKVNKKARRSKQLKQTSKKKETKQEVVKMIRSSISRPHQVNSPRIPSPRPAPPSVPRRKLLARTNSPPPKTREKENERRESHSRATPSHSHKHTHTF